MCIWKGYRSTNEIQEILVGITFIVPKLHKRIPLKFDTTIIEFLGLWNIEKFHEGAKTWQKNAADLNLFILFEK